MSRGALLPGILLAAALAAQEPVTFVARDNRAAVLKPGDAPLELPYKADPSPGGGDVFHAVVSANGAIVTLLTPSGVEITEGNAESQGYVLTAFQGLENSGYIMGPAAIPGFHTFIELPPGAQPGDYRLKVTPAALSKPATVRTFYNSSSNIRVALAPGAQTVTSGSGIAFSAIVFEGDAPVVGATVTLRVQSLDNLAAPPETEMDLPDSGPIDPQSGDGHYIDVWKSGKPGKYVAAVKVSGTSSTGIPFSRLASANFTVLKKLARIESITDAAVDDNGDGIADRMVVAAQLDVTTAGNYQMVFNMRSGERYFTSRTDRKLESGPQRFEASIAFAALAGLEADGPYGITDLFLIYTDDPEDPVADRRADAGLTGAYRLSSLPGNKPLTVAPATLEFGDVETGKEKSLDLTFTNSSPYRFTEMVVTVTSGRFSVVVPSQPLTVPANGRTTVTVVFRPTAVGAQTGTVTIAGLTVNLTGNGTAAAVVNNPVPTLTAMAPETVSAGSAGFTLSVTGTNFTPASVVRWNGNARSTTFVSATNLTAAIGAADVAAAGTVVVTVFTPAPGGGASAARNFTITSSGVPIAVIDVTPAALAFGDATVGQTKDLALTIRNTGAAGLVVQSMTSSAAQFTTPGFSPGLAVAPGGTATLTVRLIPTATGAINGTLTINSNAAARPSVAVALSGNGIASTAGPRTVTIGVDDGSYETSVGQPGGNVTIYFANRLTPPSYPATITRIQVYFGGAADELKAGYPVTLFVAQNPGGSANINGLTYQRFDATVGTVGGFNTLTLATPITINAGDFVVGFSTRNPAGIYPMSTDTTPPLRQRSYLSTDGINFTLADLISRDLAGNFAIRAVVELR
jgi:hypothetical protein